MKLYFIVIFRYRENNSEILVQ